MTQIHAEKNRKIGKNAEEINQKSKENESGLSQPSQQPIVNCVAGKSTIINNNDTSPPKSKKRKASIPAMELPLESSDSSSEDSSGSSSEGSSDDEDEDDDI